MQQQKRHFIPFWLCIRLQWWLGVSPCQVYFSCMYYAKTSIYQHLVVGDGAGTFVGISKSKSQKEKIKFDHEHVVYDGSSMNGYPLGIADSE